MAIEWLFEWLAFLLSNWRFLEVLEYLGKNGWEMTGIAPDEHYSKLFFKRPRQPKTLPAPPPVARLTSGRLNDESEEPLPPRSSGRRTTKS